jgi:hypothetical protein
MGLWRPKPRSQAGQASVELVATIPVLVAVALLLIQAAIAGWALWSAANAARAGARAEYVGGSAGSAARSALPGLLRSGASVHSSNGVEVRVATPRVLPGLPRIPVSASAGLDPEGEGGG